MRPGQVRGETGRPSNDPARAEGGGMESDSSELSRRIGASGVRRPVQEGGDSVMAARENGLPSRVDRLGWNGRHMRTTTTTKNATAVKRVAIYARRSDASQDKDRSIERE